MDAKLQNSVTFLIAKIFTTTALSLESMQRSFETPLGAAPTSQWTFDGQVFEHVLSRVFSRELLLFVVK